MFIACVVVAVLSTILVGSGWAKLVRDERIVTGLVKMATARIALVT
ncbi:hypothetical protein [Nocardia xishanensis]